MGACWAQGVFVDRSGSVLAFGVWLGGVWVVRWYRTIGGVGVGVGGGGAQKLTRLLDLSRPFRDRRHGALLTRRIQPQPLGSKLRRAAPLN